MGRARDRTLALACERQGLDPDDAAHVDGLPASERDPLLGTLVATLDESALTGAIATATETFLAELARGDSALAARLADPLRLHVQATDPDPYDDG